jgi:hypothetical protein
MPVQEFTIGISLSDRGVQAVELVRNGPTTTLLAIDEWENTFSFDDGEKARGQQKFLDYMTAFIKVNQVKARRASVAMDTSLLFISMLPMEEGLTRNEISTRRPTSSRSAGVRCSACPCAEATPPRYSGCSRSSVWNSTSSTSIISRRTLRFD